MSSNNPDPQKRRRGDTSPDRPGMRFLTRQTLRSGIVREIWLNEKAFADATARRDADRARRLADAHGRAKQLAWNALHRAHVDGLPAADLDTLTGIIEALIVSQDWRCAASGDRFGRGRYRMTADKIVRSLGYVAGNILLVCQYVNSSKKDKLTPGAILRARSNALTIRERTAVANYVAREVPAALAAA